MTLHPDEQARELAIAREWLSNKCGARWIPVNDEVRELAAILAKVRLDAVEEAAQAIERWAAGWRSRIESGEYDVQQMQAADIRRDEGMDLAWHIRSLAERAAAAQPGDKAASKEAI